MSALTRSEFVADTRVATAVANFEAQVGMVEGIRRAFEAGGLGLPLVADRLGLTEPDAQSWLDGDVDLRLSEVRHLANSVGVTVTYGVAV